MIHTHMSMNNCSIMFKYILIKCISKLYDYLPDLCCAIKYKFLVIAYFDIHFHTLDKLRNMMSQL